MKNFPQLALFSFAILGLLSAFACASYIIELTYANDAVSQTAVYYTDAEPSSPVGNYTYSIGSTTGSLDFPILELRDAKNNETDAPSDFAPMVKKTEAVAYIVVPDSAIPSTGTGTAAGSNLKIMNGTQVLLDEPLKTPTRLVPTVVAGVAGSTTTSGSSTETTTPGTSSKGDDGAGLDLFIGLIIGAIVVVAILVFLKKKAKK